MCTPNLHLCDRFMNKKMLNNYNVSLSSRLGCILLFQVICSVGLVFGNSGPFETSARIVGEPFGLTSVAIVREDLEIDFRPLADYERVGVKAVYQLENPEDVERLSIAFAFGSDSNANHRVRFNGVEIVGVKKLEDREITKQWWPPEYTPGLRPEDAPIRFRFGGWRPTEPLAFELEIPEGRSTLEVSYEEEAKVVFGRPSMYRQFAYILSPAKSWASFQDLNLIVHPPADWELVSSFDLEVDGATLVGRFNSIPADNLAFTLRPSVPWVYLFVIKYRIAVVCVITVLILAFHWRSGRVTLKRFREKEEGMELPSLKNVSLNILGSAFASALLLGGTVFFFTIGLYFVFPMSDAENLYRSKLQLSDGYRSIALFFLAVICAVVMGCFVLVDRMVLFFRCKRLARG